MNETTSEKTTTATEDLIKIVQDMHEAMKAIIGNQESLVAEQARMGKALGEAGICLQKYNETFEKHAAALVNHQEVIQKNGAAIVRLWHEAGLPVQEVPQTPTQVN